MLSTSDDIMHQCITESAILANSSYGLFALLRASNEPRTTFASITEKGIPLVTCMCWSRGCGVMAWPCIHYLGSCKTRAQLHHQRNFSRTADQVS